MSHVWRVFFFLAGALAMLALSERLCMQTDLPEDAHKPRYKISIIS